MQYILHNIVAVYNNELADGWVRIAQVLEYEQILKSCQ